MTLDRQTVDSDPEIVHVDTGLGRFDHHQSEERSSAAELVFKYLKQKKLIGSKDQRGIERLIRLVTEIDNFEDFFWSEPAADRYELSLHRLLNNLRLSGKADDGRLVEEGGRWLEAVLFGLKQKVAAEEEIKAGQEFETKWGKSLGLESQAGGVDKLGLKLGYQLVVRKEPESGFVMIKCQPKRELDLSRAYEVLKEKDKQADWFFHASRHIILNGSRHNPKVKPSRLSLEELIEILKSVK
jgi:hypothetical protein